MSIDLNLEPLEATLGAGTLIVNDYRITTEPIDGGHRLTVTRGSETQTMDVLDGVGIVGIEKTGSTGDVDSYRVTFTDGSTFDYTIETNAAKHAAAESARASAENNRAEAEEKRVSAENIRNDSESARIKAESARQGAEAARQDAETLRANSEQGRVTAEAGRVESESLRNSAESARVNAETARAGAEAQRQSMFEANEGQRQAAFTAAETGRAAAETARVNAEAGRAEAEAARVEAENARATAEEERAQAFAGYQGEINGLKDDMAAKADKLALTRTDRSLDALWKLNQGVTYQFETDNNEAYQKQVISGAKLADIQSIGGKTVVWNQYNKDIWVSCAPDNIPTGSVEKNGAEYTYTITTLRDDVFSNTLYHSVSVIIGHKYYQSFQIKSNKAFNISYSGVNANWILESYSQDNVYKYYRYIQTASTTQAIYIGYNFASSNGAVVGDSFSVKDIILIDLTQMFGAGNEPTSTDDSRIAWIEQYAAAHLEYNAGELVSADVESIKYNDAIISDIPASVRALPGYGWSAGSVYNSIERTESGWQYIQRVGKYIFDGTEEWVSNVGYCYFMNKYFDNGLQIDKANFATNVNGEYQVIRVRLNGDGLIARYSNSSVKLTLDEVKSRFSSGKVLHYEYKTPIIIDITDLMTDFLESFEVESGGTITYENAAKLAITNSIEYTVKLAEVNS